MKTSIQDQYETVRFTKSRRFLTDVVALGHRKHLIHGLIEVDVTDVRRRIREYGGKTGTPLSFTGYVIGCVAKAVDENKIMHAYRGRGHRLILFDEVDVSTLIEVEADGRRFPLGHIIRAANKRPLPDIHNEIRSLQSGNGSVGESLPGGSIAPLLLSLPAFLRRFLLRTGLRHPQAMKQRAGTVLVTAVGMFGSAGGWGIPCPMHTLAVTLGGIGEKPGAVGRNIEIREYLSLTITVDHDLIDGAPAAHFARRLTELIESGCGLEQWSQK